MAKANNYIKSIFNKSNSVDKSYLSKKRLLFNKNKFRVALWAIIILALIVTIIITAISCFGPKDAHYVKVFWEKDKPFYIPNIAIALAAIATAVFTWWKNSLSQIATEDDQKKTEIEESTRQDSLFAQAVGFLNEKNDLTTRKGGVHILKDLAMTSPRHAQKCIDMLCSLNESWMPKFLKDYPDFFLINDNFPNIKNIEELTLGNNKFVYNTLETKEYIDRIALSQLALISISEIIRYINDNNEYKGPFDLQYKYLCSIDLSIIYFNGDKFRLSNINLRNACLCGTRLQNANLRYVNLQNADLSWTNMQYADLRLADLQYADLFPSNFSGAKLRGTDFRNAKNVDKAIFDDNKKDAIFTDEDYKKYYPDNN